MDAQARIASFLKTKPVVAELFAQMNSAGIRWAMFAGCAVSLLTGNRQATDVDILVHNDDFDRLASFLPQATKTEGGVNKLRASDGTTIENVYDLLALTVPNADLEIEAHSEFKTADKSYPAYLTDLAVNNRLLFEVDGHRVFFANPFDTMLIKAMSRRGPEQNKHDAEDAAALAHTLTIDMAYAKARLQETGATPEALAFLRQTGIAL